MDFWQNIELSELLGAVRLGEDDAAFSELARRYEPMMQSRVSALFASSADVPEAMQEAHIALHSAAKSYDPDRCDGVTFGLYAGVCVGNRLKSLLRKRRREQQHTEHFVSECGSSTDVEDFIAARDLCDRVMRAARCVLSDFEFRVFSLELEGYATRDIATKLSRTPKSVDNAKARLSRRLREREDIRAILSDVY